ncbi:MAG: hypothetical protein E2O39_00440 [Planctomycetota bacterium]|nr:MAG: hypothetical protein E2O39_00440 [Planctomycetota bacterium]
MASDLIRTWRKSGQITLMLLDAIPAAQLGDRYSKRTRTVAAQFAHIHYVRVRNLDLRGGPDLLGDLTAFEKGAQPGKGELRKALKASGRAMEKLLETAESAGKVRGWKGTLASYVAYHTAHEAHHRALAIVCMRLSGYKLPQESVYGIWDAWRKGD